MTQTELIKQEIERRIKEYDAIIESQPESNRAERDAWKWVECRSLLSFLESLEKEQDGTLAPDDPATNEEIKKMLEGRRLDMLRQVQKECNRQLQEQYDRGYDDGWKAHEKVIAEYQKKKQPQGPEKGGIDK